MNTPEAIQWRPGVKVRGLRARYLDEVGHVAWFSDAQGMPHKVMPGDWLVRDSDGTLRVLSARSHEEGDS